LALLGVQALVLKHFELIFKTFIKRASKNFVLVNDGCSSSVAFSVALQANA